MIADDFEGVTDEVLRAHALATRAHAGQLDKSGEAYIDHPRRVARLAGRSGGTTEQIVAALLHDVVEDTDVTLADLDEFGAGVVQLVDALTHRNGEPNADYYDRITRTPAAVLVKLCDIYDNLDPTRLHRLDEATQARLRIKYGVALVALNDPPTAKE